MPKGRDILVRRQTARNIRKITRTMEMIATSRFRRAQGQVAGLHPYVQGLANLVAHLVREAGPEFAQPLLTERPEVRRDALLVLAANRGMCGGYNAAIVRLAVRRVRELRERNREVEVYAVGVRALAGLRSAGVEPVWHARQYESRVSLSGVAELTQTLIRRLTAGEVATVQVAYTHFVSAGAQQPSIDRLLPLGQLVRPQPADLAGAPRAREYDFMPADPGRILDELLPRTAMLRLYQAFLDAMVSEHVARMTAMRAATDNAEEMAQQLTRDYNRARQTGITRELAEIIGGAEAMK